MDVQSTSGVAFKVNPTGVAGKAWYIDATNPDHLKHDENIVISADPGNAHANTLITFNIDGAIKAVITSGGNVGVGTSSPDGLQVSSAVSQTARGADNVRMGVVGGGFPIILLEDTTASPAQWQIGNIGNEFRINDIDAATVRLAINSSGTVRIANALEVDGNLDHDGSNIGFYGATPVAKPTVTGSRGGNAALASLLTALDSQGLITNSTTA